MKIRESLDTVYIYIYIIGFNKINMNKHRKETMLFRRI